MFLLHMSSNETPNKLPTMSVMCSALLLSLPLFLCNIIFVHYLYFTLKPFCLRFVISESTLCISQPFCCVVTHNMLFN